MANWKITTGRFAIGRSRSTDQNWLFSAVNSSGAVSPLTRAMAKNPAERFQSYDEFIMALTAARSQILIRQFAPQSGGTTRWWRR